MSLSIEIWQRADVLDNMLILLSAAGSTFFIITPYVANLIFASKMGNFVKHNMAAKAWFRGNSALFSILVVLTGGAYPALALVSSRIFGLSVTSSGLTDFELGKLSKIKVLSPGLTLRWLFKVNMF